MDEYEIIIVGAGVAGLSAAMYAGRLGLKSLVLGKSYGSEFSIGGVITTTNIVENYPGFIRITGAELAEKIKKHAESSSESVKIKEEKVEKVEKKDGGFLVKTNKAEYKSKTILFATGTRWRKLDVPGAKEFETKGVSFCALCDAPLYKNKTAAVIGGSDAAVKDALILGEHAKKVYIIYRREKLRAELTSIKKIKEKKNIEIINNTNVVEVRGNKIVESVVLDKSYKGSKKLFVDGIFVAIGHIPLSELAQEIGVKVNEKEEIIINHKTSETNIKGIYAAGDVTNKSFKQAITGVADGVTATHSAFQHIAKYEAKSN